MPRLNRAIIKSLARVVAVINITTLAIACGGGSATDRTGKGGDDATFRVALLTPGPISDQAWNAGAYAGLLQIRDSLNAQISHIETATPAQFEENFRQYGARGYDLVFGHGFEFQDAAERVSRDYPNTVFVTTSSNRARDNAVGMEFAFEEGSYIAGMVAASISRSGILGSIGGTELPPVRRSFDAFAAGARAVNPSARVVTSYVGNWEDASAGKELALAQINRGADVIFANADAAGLGIFQAARESGRVRLIGANSDQAHVAPEVVIGSVVIDLPHAFLMIAREVSAGAFVSRVITFGSGSDVVRWVYNPALESQVPPGARAAVDSAIASLRAGTFVVDTTRPDFLP